MVDLARRVQPGTAWSQPTAADSLAAADMQRSPKPKTGWRAGGGPPSLQPVLKTFVLLDTLHRLLLKFNALFEACPFLAADQPQPP